VAVGRLESIAAEGIRVCVCPGMNGGKQNVRTLMAMVTLQVYIYAPVNCILRFNG